MRPVTCRQCGTEVLVEKHSWQHTNTQWSAPSQAVCPRIRDQVAAGVPASRAAACEPLRASVLDAVERGIVPVPD